jgi:hypothetical protein
MNLTNKLKAKIVGQFCAGHSIAEIAGWYDKSCTQIEAVLRECMLKRQDEWIADAFPNYVDGKRITAESPAEVPNET